MVMMMHTRASLVLLLTLACLFSVGLGASYSLVDNFSGSNFFPNFNFYTGPDPTHGYVYYASAAEASSWGYTYVSNNVVTIRSDSTQISSGSGRGSVRISSKKSYSSGLFLFDIKHMPVGCGTWPAVWTFGPNWPNSGEIDILEGVNNQAKNKMTLHSKAGCTMPANLMQTGQTKTTNCDVNSNGNEGCGTEDVRTNSYGTGFNNNGGGVHAMLWTSSGIKIWFFPRNQIPGDISSGNPNPDVWGTPAANFPFGQNCPSTHYVNHNIILDNTFCGDWAGQANVWAQSGCPSDCVTYVKNNPGAFAQSFWEINSFKVYQPSSGSNTATSASATSATASSSSGQATSGCPSGERWCPGINQCFKPSAYACVSASPYLCPVSAPNACNGGCSPNRC